MRQEQKPTKKSKKILKTFVMQVTHTLLLIRFLYKCNNFHTKEKSRGKKKQFQKQTHTHTHTCFDNHNEGL